MTQPTDKPADLFAEMAKWCPCQGCDSDYGSYCQATTTTRRCLCDGGKEKCESGFHTALEAIADEMNPDQGHLAEGRERWERDELRADCRRKSR
jgi:hypothetical protein